MGEFLAALTLLALVGYILYLQGVADDLMARLEKSQKARRDMAALAKQAEVRAALTRLGKRGSTT